MKERTVELNLQCLSQVPAKRLEKVHTAKLFDERGRIIEHVEIVQADANVMRRSEERPRMSPPRPRSKPRRR